jgi:hypothetical protein
MKFVKSKGFKVVINPTSMKLGEDVDLFIIIGDLSTGGVINHCFLGNKWQKFCINATVKVEKTTELVIEEKCT